MPPKTTTPPLPRSSIGFRFEAPTEAWLSIARSMSCHSPKTVIDVGVGHGTPNLYAAFPDAHQVLVEPIAKFEPDIKRILSQYQGSWIQAAANDIKGLGRIFVEEHYEEMSSFAQRNDTQWHVRDVAVELVRLTELVDAHQFEGPYVIKTDVEGFDLNVLKGAQGILTETPLVISECRLDSEFGNPTLSPIINFLHANNFEICNMLEARWNQDGSLRWVNVAFKNQRF